MMMTTTTNNNTNNNTTAAAARAARAAQIGAFVVRIGGEAVITDADAQRALRAAHVLVAGARGLSPTHFGRFLEALPERLPMHWTAADARALSATLAAALSADAAADHAHDDDAQEVS